MTFELSMYLVFKSDDDPQRMMPLAPRDFAVSNTIRMSLYRQCKKGVKCIKKKTEENVFNNLSI